MIGLFRRRPEVVLACADPELLGRAVRVLDGRARLTAAPTTDVLEAVLRGRPALVAVHPSLREGEVPLGRLAPALKAAVPLEELLADPEGVLRRARPAGFGAVPPGVYAVAGAAGGVGTTAAALGLARALARGGPTALFEVGLGRRPSALAGRGLGREADELLLAEAGAAGAALGELAREAGCPVGLALSGRVVAEVLGRRGPGALRALFGEAARAFRYVVVDLSAGLDPDLAGARAGFVVTDLRPEAAAAARELSAAAGWPVALAARRLEGVGVPHAVRLQPPPDPDRWGRVLAGHLLRRF